MPNIKPISDLRNYSAVLEDVTVGSPVYLTKNGHGCYTIMDINEQEEMSRKARKYDKMVAELEVMKILNEGFVFINAIFICIIKAFVFINGTFIYSLYAIEVN